MGSVKSDETKLMSTGIPGLDEILRGGITPQRTYLVEGTPGTGKTTLALQFLLEGVRQGESTLYITLSESREELLAVGRSHGWDLSKIPIHEMAPSEDSLSSDRQLTMYHPAELELTETTKTLMDEIDRLKPKRLVFDSLAEIRLMSQSGLRYRRQILALKQFFLGRQATVLLLDDQSSGESDVQLHSITHGVIELRQRPTEFGAERRQITVIKYRGVSFRGGLHDFAIRRGGLDVFPRILAADHYAPFTESSLASGVESLDRLMGGGLPVASSTLMLGPAGCGKSTVAMQFCAANAARGERSALYIFDETVATLMTRARKLHMRFDEFVKNGLITIQQIDPAELSPGEFANIVQCAINGTDGKKPTKIVMIDSLNGYLNSMAEEKQLNSQLHELFTYASQKGVSTLITVAQSGMAGSQLRTPIDTTYLADNVIQFRYFECFGTVRRAISVMKKRSGPHELTIRELRMSSEGIHIGEPLKEFQGVLTGVPAYHGKIEQLMNAAGQYEQPGKA